MEMVGFSEVLLTLLGDLVVHWWIEDCWDDEFINCERELIAVFKGEFFVFCRKLNLDL